MNIFNHKLNSKHKANVSGTNKSMKMERNVTEMNVFLL